MTRNSLAAVAILATSVGLFAGGGCGVENGIVGGECAPAYVACGGTCIQVDHDPANCGACGYACAPGVGCTGGLCDDGSNDPDAAARRDGARDRIDGARPPDGSLGDSGVADDSGADGSDGSGGCAPPQIYCGLTCVDSATDPDNCGGCGHSCPSNVCLGGACQGAAAGHVVAIGHDYQNAPSATSSQARVLANAVFIAKSNPVAVLSFEHYCPAQDVSNVTSLLAAQAKKLGRTVNVTHTAVDGDVSSGLTINDYDVLLACDQRTAPPGVLAALGSAWSNSGKISDFLHAGGVVVLLDGATGSAEMPALSSNMGALAITAHAAQSSPQLVVLAPGDAVGSGVVSPYVPTKSTAWFTTEPASSTVTYVAGTSAAQPAVVHKVLP